MIVHSKNSRRFHTDFFFFTLDFCPIFFFFFTLLNIIRLTVLIVQTKFSSTGWDGIEPILSLEVTYGEWRGQVPMEVLQPPVFWCFLQLVKKQRLRERTNEGGVVSYLPYSRLSSELDDQEHRVSNPCQKLIQPPEICKNI